MTKGRPEVARDKLGVTKDRLLVARDRFEVDKSRPRVARDELGSGQRHAEVSQWLHYQVVECSRHSLVFSPEHKKAWA